MKLCHFGLHTPFDRAPTPEFFSTSRAAFAITITSNTINITELKYETFWSQGRKPEVKHFVCHDSVFATFHILAFKYDWFITTLFAPASTIRKRPLAYFLKINSRLA